MHTYLRHLQDEYLDLGATYAEQAHADPTHAERRDALAASIEALDPEVRVLYCGELSYLVLRCARSAPCPAHRPSPPLQTSPRWPGRSAR